MTVESGRPDTAHSTIKKKHQGGGEDELLCGVVRFYDRWLVICFSIWFDTRTEGGGGSQLLLALQMPFDH